MPRILFWFWYAVGAALLLIWTVPESLGFSNGLFLVFYALYAAYVLFKGQSSSHMSDRSVIFGRGMNARRFWQLPLVRFTAAMAGIWTGGMAAEWAGVHTGHLFGSYAYSPILGPLMWGVPVTLGFAWIGVVCNALLLTRETGGRRLPGMLLRGLQTAVWAVLLDLVLDPVAQARGFWDWGYDGGWYGVPLSNFTGWFVIGALLSLLVKPVPVPYAARREGTRLYQGMLVLFGLLGLKEGLPGAAVIGLAAILLSEGSLRYARGR